MFLSAFPTESTLSCNLVVELYYCKIIAGYNKVIVTVALVVRGDNPFDHLGADGAAASASRAVQQQLEAQACAEAERAEAQARADVCRAERHHREMLRAVRRANRSGEVLDSSIDAIIGSLLQASID